MARRRLILAHATWDAIPVIDRQQATGIHVMRLPHALGFVERAPQSRTVRSVA